ncbi:MAG TPA: glycosyltransferase 87 family protein [Trebonia sp.]
MAERIFVHSQKHGMHESLVPTEGRGSREVHGEVRVRAAHPKPRPDAVIVTVTGLLAAGLTGYLLAQPHVLVGVHGYDDGVYLGSAIELIHGIVPYKDFSYLHPPGMPLLLSPVAAVGELTGSPIAMLIARLLTAAVAVAVAALGAWLLRYRGPVAMLATGLVLAVLPPATYADQSLMLEPYLMLFCLLGALALFDPQGSFTASKPRTILGGVAFGFACAIKIWALMPIVALIAVCCATRRRRTFRWLLGGVAVGAGIPVLPFLVMAPAQFLNDVVITQLTRQSPAADAASILQRFQFMTGLAGPPGLHAPGVAAGAALTVLAVVATVAYATSRPAALDWFIGLAAVVVVTGMCLSSQFYDHYGYFAAVFLALLLGVVTGLAGRAVTRSGRMGKWSTRGMRFVVSVIVLCGAALMVPQDTALARGYVAGGYDPGPALASRVPAGACVVADEATLLLNAGRFSTARDCPLILDPFGQWIADDPSNPPPETMHNAPALVQAWQTALSTADYVVEVAPGSDFVPWTPGLWAYFDSHYVLVYDEPGAYLYEHVRLPARPVLPVAGSGGHQAESAGG